MNDEPLFKARTRPLSPFYVRFALAYLGGMPQPERVTLYDLFCAANAVHVCGNDVPSLVFRLKAGIVVLAERHHYGLDFDTADLSPEEDFVLNEALAAVIARQPLDRQLRFEPLAFFAALKGQLNVWPGGGWPTNHG